MASRRTPAPVSAALVLLAAGTAARAAYSLGLGNPELERIAVVWVYSFVMYGCALVCLARGVFVRRDRLAWSAIGGGTALWATGDTLYELYYGQADVVPFPNLADACYYASYPLLYIGLVLLVGSRLRPFRAALWLDGLVTGLALAAVTAALVVPVVVEANAGDLRTLAFAVAYPVADGALICLAAVAFALTGWRPGRMWALLGVGLVVMGAADSIYTYQVTVGTYETGTLLGVLWPLACLCLATAAWQPAGRRSDHDGGLRLLVLPGVSGLVAIAVLVVGQVEPLADYAVGLAATALLVGVLRAALSFSENAALLRQADLAAHTDGLTGLGNRRRLLADLDDLVVDAGEGTLAFFDLNGFKNYNDAFGHGAGDALLARLGAALGRAVVGTGRAYRLGGDEFCVLLDHAGSSSEAVVQRAVAALAEHGDGFAVTTSYGLVVLPTEAATASAALQLADERMYADKEGRSSGRRQARDVILQILRESAPDLRQHLDGVAGLAVEVGQHLGLQPDALDELARAAELHDVGKVALPEELLRKPGPLTAEEWGFVHQHTIVGERILNAAPALRPAALLVRSSHERWDGGGYPDGLAGEDVPVGARVIAVCDSFHAMVTGRPYRPAVPAEEALRELERCSGTQFDPQVVAALLVVVRRPTGLPAPEQGQGQGQRQEREQEHRRTASV